MTFFPTRDEKLILRTHEFLAYFFKSKGDEFTTGFKWIDDKLINLIKSSQEFKCSTEFRNWNSNADKSKLYESVRKGLAEIYEDERKAFSCPQEGKEFDTKSFPFTRGYYISIWFEIFHFIFLKSVYRIKVSTRDENPHIISPLVNFHIRNFCFPNVQ